MTKRTLMAAAALLVSATFAADTGAKKTTSLAEARAMIAQVIEEPAKMTEVMKGLSQADQVTFIAEVNAAIAAMPGSAEERTTAFVEANNAALAGAQKGNALTLVAEVFATVPPYALTAVSESLASGMMNRTTDSTTYTDAQYAHIAKTVMAKVNERVANEDNAGVRSALTGLMLINASNGTSPEIVDAVVESLPEDVRNDAKTEWYPAALAANGGKKSYDAIMAAVEGGAGGAQDSASGTVESLVSLRVSSAQNYEGILSDIVSSSTDPKAAASEFTPMVDAIQNPLVYNLPNTAGDTGGDTGTIVDDVTKYIEGDGYSGQHTGQMAN